MKPILWRVLLYFVPRLPRPTMSILFGARQQCCRLLWVQVCNLNPNVREQVINLLPREERTPTRSACSIPPSFSLPLLLPLPLLYFPLLLPQSSLLSLPLPPQLSLPQLRLLAQKRGQLCYLDRLLPLTPEGVLNLLHVRNALLQDG